MLKVKPRAFSYAAGSPNSLRMAIHGFPRILHGQRDDHWRVDSYLPVEAEGRVLAP